jgi:hypothetical protein
MSQCRFVNGIFKNGIPRAPLNPVQLARKKGVCGQIVLTK